MLSRKDHVVGRLLARLPQLSGRQPNQRMEPVRHARQTAQQVHQAVAAADMPKLVQQHAAFGLVGPCRAACGNENHRPPQTPGHWNRHLADTRRTSIGRRKPHWASNCDKM